MPEQQSDKISDIMDALSEIKLFSIWGALGADKVISFSFLDHLCKMSVPLAHSDLIQRTIVLNRTFYEHYALMRVRPYIPKGSIILDVGANIGNHTVFFGKVCQARKVHAFEPGRIAHQILQDNVRVNGLDNVVIHNCAIGSGHAFATLRHFSQKNLGGMALSEAPAGDYPVRPLDSFHFDAIDFVKIDVESSEGAVLDGAVNTLTRLSPKLWVEILSDQPDHPTRTKLGELGYSEFAALGKTDFLFAKK